MQKRSMDELERKTVDEFRQSEKFPIIVVLENARSAYNVGSVLRTADAFLLEAVYTTGYTAHPPHRQIAKTALGADETVASKHFSNATEAIVELQQNGYLIYAIEQVQKSIPLQQFEVKEDDKIALIFGNEVTGVEQETILLCDGCIEIPQMGTKHSLNIATAAGIVLWECVRQLLTHQSIQNENIT